MLHVVLLFVVALSTKFPHNRSLDSIIVEPPECLRHSGSLPVVLLLPQSFHLDTRGMPFVFIQLDVYQLH